MALITMLTDFGLKDGNVGVMKGVILNIAPATRIVDLSHTISAQNVHEAALVLLRSAPYFPDGSIHLVVVDPGVGTDRRAIAAQLGAHYFVGPDNGVITMLLDSVARRGLVTRFVHLDKPEFWLPEVSNVFHGRDVFAPCAAHLAAGVLLEMLGTAIAAPIRLEIPAPRELDHGWQGEVIHIDHFGNISSNIRLEHLGERRQVVVRLDGTEIHGLVRAFGERPAGELVALFGSTGNLIVSVVNGNAAERLGTVVGDPIEVLLRAGSR